MSEVKQIQIPKEFEEKFKTISEKTKISIVELKQRYAEFFQKEGSAKIAMNKLKAEVSEENGSLISTAVPFYGYVLGDSGLFDWIDLMSQKSKDMYENPETQNKAVKDGYTTEDGVPLERRQKKFGRPNEKCGQPLEGTEYERDLYVIASANEDFSNAKLAMLSANNEDATNIKNVDLFKTIKFRANVGKIDATSNMLNLRIGAGTKFRESECKLTPIEIANKVNYIDATQEEIASEYDIFAKNPKTKYMSIVRGTVSKIYMEPSYNTKNPARTIYIMSSEEDIASIMLRVRIPISIPIVIREGEDIQVFGRIWKSFKTGKYTLEAKGYIPIC
jgi:hypothetical protein